MAMEEAGNVPMGWHHFSLQVPVYFLWKQRPQLPQAQRSVNNENCIPMAHHHCILETNTNFFMVLLTLVQSQWL